MFKNAYFYFRKVIKYFLFKSMGKCISKLPMRAHLCLFILCFSACVQKSQTVMPEAAGSGWKILGPGGGGATYIPTFSYHSAERFFVKCDMTGMYSTNDGGATYDLKNFIGEINVFAFDRNDSSTVYAAGDILYKSVDQGKTWFRLLPGPSEIKGYRYLGDHANVEFDVEPGAIYNIREGGIRKLQVDPVDSKKIYLATDSSFYYTVDGGETWKKEIMKSSIEHLYVSPDRENGRVSIFTPGGIVIFDRTTGTFAEREYPSAMRPAYSFSAGRVAETGSFVYYALHHDIEKENDFVFAHSELWSSADGGESWTKATDQVITNEASRLNPSLVKVVCAEDDAATAYVVCNNYEEKTGETATVKWYGALKTSDAGKTWQWVWKGGGGSGRYGVYDARDAENLDDAWVKNAFGKEFIQLIDVGVCPTDGRVAIVTDWYRTMKTSDGGTSWKEVYSVTHAGGTFTSRGMDVTTSYGVHFDPHDSLHIGISYTDIGYHHSFDGGVSWARSVNGVPSAWVNTCYWAVFDPSVKGRVWSAWGNLHDIPRGKMTRSPNWKDGYARGGVCVSDDGGKTWMSSVDGMGPNSLVTSLALDPRSPGDRRTLYAAVYNKGIFKSVDGGKTWQLKNKGIGENTCAFEITIAGNGNLYLVVSPVPVHRNKKPGREFHRGALYRSTDAGETWARLNVGDPMIFPSGIDIDAEHPNRIYLAAWSDIRLADLVGKKTALETGGDSVLRTAGGVFKSEDGGDTWIQVFDDRQYVYDVTVDRRHPGRLYINTFNHAAYRSDDHGKTWSNLKEYDFHWGHRVVPDAHHSEKIYITTFGSSVWHGLPDITGTDRGVINQQGLNK